MAGVASTLPAAGSLTIIILLPQTEYRTHFRIDGEAAGAVAGRDGIALRHQRVLGIDLDDFVLVFDVDEDVAFAVHLRELGLAAEGNRRGDHVAGLGVDRGRVAAAAVEGEDAMRDRLINDGVGILAGLDFAQNLQRFDVEDGDVVVGAVAGEAFAEIGGDGDAVDAFGVGNGADELVGRGVDHFGLRAVRDVETMIGAVDDRRNPSRRRRRF